MKETSGGWKAWTAVVGAVVALWAPAAVWIAREPGPPPRRTQVATAGRSGSRVQRVRPPQLDPSGTEAMGEAIAARAPDDPAERGETIGEVEQPLDAALASWVAADVRPPPPPEDFLPVQPRAFAPSQDLDLEFFDQLAGGGAVGAKEENPHGAQAWPSDPTSPGPEADLRPAPDPEAAELPPPVTSDPDTDPVFSDQPPPSDRGEQ